MLIDRAGPGPAAVTLVRTGISASPPSSDRCPARLATPPKLRANIVRIQHRFVAHVASHHLRKRRVEIPIVRAAPLRPKSRGFLPWRFSDDGPVSGARIVIGRHPKTFTTTDVEGVSFTV